MIESLNDFIEAQGNGKIIEKFIEGKWVPWNLGWSAAGKFRIGHSRWKTLSRSTKGAFLLDRLEGALIERLSDHHGWVRMKDGESFENEVAYRKLVKLHWFLKVGPLNEMTICVPHEANLRIDVEMVGNKMVNSTLTKV